MLTFQDFYPQKNETLENSNADKAKWNEAFVSIDDFFNFTDFTIIELDMMKQILYNFPVLTFVKDESSVISQLLN